MLLERKHFRKRKKKNSCDLFLKKEILLFPLPSTFFTCQKNQIASTKYLLFCCFLHRLKAEEVKCESKQKSVLMNSDKEVNSGRNSGKCSDLLESVSSADVNVKFHQSMKPNQTASLPRIGCNFYHQYVSKNLCKKGNSGIICVSGNFKAQKRAL